LFRSGEGTEFFTEIHQGIGWLGVGEKYYFSYHGSWRKVLYFRIADPCPGTNFSQLWQEKKFGEKLKEDVWRIINEKVYRKAQGQFSQISE